MWIQGQNEWKSAQSHKKMKRKRLLFDKIMNENPNEYNDAFISNYKKRWTW